MGPVPDVPVRQDVILHGACSVGCSGRCIALHYRLIYEVEGEMAGTWIAVRRVLVFKTALRRLMTSR